MSQIVPDGKEKKKVEKDENDEQKSLHEDLDEKEEKTIPIIMSVEQTLFFDAVKKSTLNERLLTALLAKNIAIDGEDADGLTASCRCIGRNDLTMLQLLLD